jgi:paraquat-inducible protein A
MTIPQKPSLIACHGCDLLLANASAVAGKQLYCPRCKTLLFQKKTNSIDKILAISLSGLMVYFPAIFYPLMHLNSLGLHQQGSVFDAFLSFYQQQFYFVAVVLFLTSILFPLVKLCLLLIVALHLKFKWSNKNLAFIFRAANSLDEWGMPDVYLLAIFVSVIKISSVASIQYGLGFFCFLFLVLMTRATASALDPELFWREIHNLNSKYAGDSSHD